MSDTAYLQKLLSESGGFVRVPDGNYSVDAPLMLDDNTHIFCSPRTVIRLADGANCPILVNRPKEDGSPTVNVTVEGGIWDGNNVNQKREKYSYFGLSWGQLIGFTNIENLTIKSLTVKDPNSFGIQLANVNRFTVTDIFFDCNRMTFNQDGVHVDGWAKDGYIANLKGYTNDDFVALNSDEGDFCGSDNDIENVVIDGIYGGDNGWTGVRLLSRKANVKHITIRNIFGAYNYNAVSFTHWGKVGENYGFFDDIIIDSIHCSSARHEGTGHGGLIWFQDGVKNVGTVVLSNFFRTEPDDHFNITNTVAVSSGAKLKNLYMTNVFQKIPDEKPWLFVDPTSKVDNLVIDGVKRDAKEFDKYLKD